MQMTQAAAIAILAFTSAAAAQYYPEADYGSIYARDAEPEYDDLYDIYARDAEPEAEADAEAEEEFELSARDAYELGFEEGLYARAGGDVSQMESGLLTQQKDNAALGADSRKEAGIAKEEKKLASEMKGLKGKDAGLRAGSRNAGKSATAAADRLSHKQHSKSGKSGHSGKSGKTGSHSGKSGKTGSHSGKSGKTASHSGKTGSHSAKSGKTGGAKKGLKARSLLDSFYDYEW